MSGRSQIEAGATTFTVNSTDNVDDGACNVTHCSLREAMDAANEMEGPNTITFALGGPPPYRIQVDELMALPGLTDPGTIIDGTSQPGYDGAPLVEIVGDFFANGIVASADFTEIRGLSVQAMIVKGEGTIIADNYVGPDSTGMTLLPGLSNILGAGVTVDGTSSSENSPTIGPGNVIAGNPGAQLKISGSARIFGNILGLGSDGKTQLGPGQATIDLTSAHRAVIGGPSPGDGNVIVGYHARGAIFSSGDNINPDENIIQGNLIGLAIDGTEPAWWADLSGEPEVSHLGIQMQGVMSGWLIGGSTTAHGNTFGFHQLCGVDLEIGVDDVTISHNRFVESNCAIQFIFGTENDAMVPPAVNSADYLNPGFSVSGTTVPGSTVEIYTVADTPLLNLDFLTATVSSESTGAWSALVDALPGTVISATATNPEGSTSEFTSSFLLSVPEPPPVGGIALDADAGLHPLAAHESTSHNFGVLAWSITATTGVLALGGAAWYARKRLTA